MFKFGMNAIKILKQHGENILRRGYEFRELFYQWCSSTSKTINLDSNQ
jgi:hypothetical protein